MEGAELVRLIKLAAGQVVVVVHGELALVAFLDSTGAGTFSGVKEGACDFGIGMAL